PSNATIEAFQELTPASSGVVSSIDLESPLITNRNRFGLRFSGSIDIPRDGVYRFYTRSDDGSRLCIDGKLVVNNDGNHGSVEREGEVQLGEGPHEIVVTYFNSSGGHELAVFWRPPGSRKRTIPADRFMGISAQAVQDAAIAALPQFPERSAQTFAALAPLVIEGERSGSAIAALGALDASKWPADKIAPVLNALIGQLKAVPALKRADESPRAIANLAKRIVEIMPADRATMYQTELDELKVVT